MQGCSRLARTVGLQVQDTELYRRLPRLLVMLAHLSGPCPDHDPRQPGGRLGASASRMASRQCHAQGHAAAGGHSQRLAVAHTVSGVLGRMCRMWRNPLRQAAHPALRATVAHSQRHRMQFHMGCQLSLQRLLHRPHGPRAGVGQFALRGQRRVWFRHACINEATARTRRDDGARHD